MKDISFDDLRAALGVSQYRLSGTSRFVIREDPIPFVPPTLRAASDDPLQAEVVLVVASAAVGKSTVAARLSAVTGTPLLDLAQVPVSTHTLAGLLTQDLIGPEPLAAFHSGRLPLIIDALDEGRLTSGERGYEGFFQTAAELLGKERSVPNRPKLVLFGRPVSAGLARNWFELVDPQISVSEMEIGFFDEEGARSLIDAWANATAQSDAPYRRHPGPVRDLVDAYFAAIEAALGLELATLWRDANGRAFAGYAPVLAALGSLLGGMDTFNDVTNRLRGTGRGEAWDVLGTVLAEILKREQSKMTVKLAQQISVAVPPEAYDEQEQLSLLAAYVEGMRLRRSTRVALQEPDASKYDSMVDQYLPDHPFLRNGKLENPVLASRVFAHAVRYDLLPTASLSRLDETAHQPFLWRFLERLLDANDLLDGKFLGRLLQSFWSDPLTVEPSVSARSREEAGDIGVVIRARGKQELTIRFLGPLEFLGSMRDCDVDVAGRVVLQGQANRGAAPNFNILGQCRLFCDSAEIIADSVTIDGDAQFEASEVITASNLTLRLVNGSLLRGAGQFSSQYPWNRYQAPPPPMRDTMVACLEDCARRLSDGSAITLYEDYSVADDKRMRWVERDYPSMFPGLLRLLVDHDLATREPIQASGSPKFRIRPKIGWTRLLRIVSGVDDPEDLAAFVGDVQKLIPRSAS